MLRSSGEAFVTSRPSKTIRPGRRQKPGNQIEERGLSAARGAEQGISPTVGPFERDLLQRPVAIGAIRAFITVPQVAQDDAGHYARPSTSRCSASKNKVWSMST